ncbi:MAG: hypothetical protein ACFFCW_34855 [Candidatus Hodarchaeota archaeon]
MTKVSARYWKGTWAAGKQLKVMNQDIESYANPHYVYLGLTMTWTVYLKQVSSS